MDAENIFVLKQFRLQSVLALGAAYILHVMIVCVLSKVREDIIIGFLYEQKLDCKVELLTYC